MKPNSNAAEDQRHALDAALHDHERIGLAGFLQRRREAVGILLLVAELEAVDRHDFQADLETPFGVQQLVDAFARAPPASETRTWGTHSGFFPGRCDTGRPRTTGT
jgi:hypothetical protein